MFYSLFFLLLYKNILIKNVLGKKNLNIKIDIILTLEYKTKALEFYCSFISFFSVLM